MWQEEGLVKLPASRGTSRTGPFESEEEVTVSAKS